MNINVCFLCTCVCVHACRRVYVCLRLFERWRGLCGEGTDIGSNGAPRPVPRWSTSSSGSDALRTMMLEESQPWAKWSLSTKSDIEIGFTHATESSSNLPHLCTTNWHKCRMEVCVDIGAVSDTRSGDIRYIQFWYNRFWPNKGVSKSCFARIGLLVLHHTQTQTSLEGLLE